MSRVLRLCASMDSLPGRDCAIPERCEIKHCEGCNRPVHYDPKASIPELGQEVILCEVCVDKLLDQMEASQ